MSHFQQHNTEPPFSPELVNEFRHSLDTLLPLEQPLNWQVRADQPLCLEVLSQISRYMQDPGTELFPALIQGFSTGFQDTIAPSEVFPIKRDIQDIEKPDLSVHMTNWHSSESQPELTAELVNNEEITKGWLICFDGTLEQAKQRWPLGVAVGKLGIAVSDVRPPRLVVDFTVSGTNPNCEIPEHQQLPSAKDVYDPIHFADIMKNWELWALMSNQLTNCVF